jgi:cation diffusion facilitator CzcD-associated flavoprotein CzcO
MSATPNQRICVIGAGPCGLTALKNLLQVGCRDVVCYDEGTAIGGNWAFTDDSDRASVPDCTHLISSRNLAAFDDFPMPADLPDFPSHRQLLGYLIDYARAFHLQPHIRLGTQVQHCVVDDHGKWTVGVVANGVARTEVFDNLLVCTGHHREAYLPTYPGTFTGLLLHSSTYKRPDQFRGKRVLVVGAGNSAADIAVDVARLASQTALSVRTSAYFVPKLVAGRPVDAAYEYWRSKLSRSLIRMALRWWLRLTIGSWNDYGLPTPTDAPLDRPPTVNSRILDEIRHGRIKVRPGIEHYDGTAVDFTDGQREEFDVIIMATGFRAHFLFLPSQVVPGYLRMTHPTMPGLFFIGLFQTVGCIWRLADYQARIAALQITGRLSPPADIGARIHHEPAGQRRLDRIPPRAIEVDYHAFRRALERELASAGYSDDATQAATCARESNPSLFRMLRM